MARTPKIERLTGVDIFASCEIKEGDFVCGICKKDISCELIAYLRFRQDIRYRKSKNMPLNKPSKRRNKININVDHIVPKSKGGKSKRENYQITHMTCNGEKGNKYEPE